MPPLTYISALGGLTPVQPDLSLDLGRLLPKGRKNPVAVNISICDALKQSNYKF